MKLWITGVRGALGSALYKQANLLSSPSIVHRSKYDSIHGDSVTGNSWEGLLATTRQEVDISCLSSIRDFAKKNPGITHIVNCAAFSLVDAAEVHQQEAFQTNSLGPENLGMVAKEIGARLIHVSTDYVFSGQLTRPLTEEDPTEPCNCYGKTKLEGEQRLRHVFPSACIIRTSWLFGPNGKNFVASLLQLLQTNEEILLTNDHLGRPTYIVDLAQAIFHLLDVSGLYHFANQGETNKYEFGLKMKEEAAAAGFPLCTKRILLVPGDTFSSLCKRPAYSAFDTTKIELLLPMPIRSWNEALRDYLCDLSTISS